MEPPRRRYRVTRSSSGLSRKRSGMASLSAVVLSIGEPYTDRAIASVERQSLAPRQVLVVRHQIPFHKALNFGAAQVTGEYFVQVDADMILDSDCFEKLHACMEKNVGLAVG